MTRSPLRRTVVTGIGVVAPGGVTRAAFWSLLSEGRTATRRISLFDASLFRSRVAAECDFDPVAAGLSAMDRRLPDRFVQFGFAAAAEATVDCGLEPTEQLRDRMGVVLGSAVGGATAEEQERTGRVDVDYLAANIAVRYGVHGPVQVISTGATSGIDSIGCAHQLIQDGDADVVIAGAADSPLSPVTAASFDAIKATTPDNHDPAHACRPFDRDRNGFVLGEGAAVLILEELGHALGRDAPIYCEVTGYAARSNGFPVTGRIPDGTEMSLAIAETMRQAKLNPTDISYICAHGSGTRQNDRIETAALKRSLGQAAYGIPVSSIKSMIGHSMGAIGAIEMAACALAIDTGVVPPTANWRHRDPECDLDYVPNIARAQAVDVALSVSSGFGGSQSAMVLSKFTDIRQ